MPRSFARRRPLLRGEAAGWAMAAGAMCVAAVLGLWGLGAHPFWDDEANTAIYARNLLRFGKLTAWDGRNLVGYAYGGSLGEDLGRELRVPGLPAYLAAAGFALFGETVWAGRLPFVFCGVAGVGLLAVWLRRHLGPRFAWWLPAWLLALSPAYLLYVRNCRYYALGVLATLALWALWAPGRRRRQGSGVGGQGSGPLDLLDAALGLRLAGAVAAALVLMGTHYLNAAAAMLSLPVVFLHRRYRQPRQYALLAGVYLAAGLFGLWTFWTANPWAAEYAAAGDWLFGRFPQPGAWDQFADHLGWLLRDLGTHEFFPWVLVLTLLFPWLAGMGREEGAGIGGKRSAPLAASHNKSSLAASQSAAAAPPLVRLERSKPLALRGGILAAIVLGNVLLAALLTPPDMGRGPTAEMRYVVPLCAVGAALAGVAATLLWRASRLFALLAVAALLGSNFLHLGFLIPRADGTNPWWPPTLYRYAWEQRHGYTTSNAEMIAMLAEMPPGTTVRAWPTYLVYPPMFELPQLRYCDQLTEQKPIDRRRVVPPPGDELPDYLFTERAEPEVVIVPAVFIARAMAVLEDRFGEGSYELRRALVAPWFYTLKPEIPNHFFFGPPKDAHAQPGLVLLVRTDSPVSRLAVVQPDRNDAEELLDAEEHFRLATTLIWANRLDEATDRYAIAVRRRPMLVAECTRLGEACARAGFHDAAVAHYAAVLRAMPDRAADFLAKAERQIVWTPWLAKPYFEAVAAAAPDLPGARAGFGRALAAEGDHEAAVEWFRDALAADPGDVAARVDLAESLEALGRRDEAAVEYRAARLEAAGDDALLRRIDEGLRRCGAL
jgi:hypothetical protein